MSTSLEILRAEVLGLPQAERAQLLNSLIASLDQDAELEAAWDAVADSREAGLDAGTEVARPLEDVLRRLDARFPG